MRRLAPLLALAALALPATTAAQQPEPRTSLADIEDEVMCVVCGLPLEVVTEDRQAQAQRAFIRELVAQGLTKEEIKDRLVAEYGDEVLALPEAEGFDLAAWVVPGLGIVIAGIGIGIGLWRWRRSGSDDDSSGEPPPESLSPEEAKRLEEDLARYEL